MIEAFITNAEKYSEGNLCGDWLTIPATKKDVQALLSRIGVDGSVNQEYIVTDYRVGIFGLIGLNEHADIDELNYFASLLSQINTDDIDIFEAAAIVGTHSGSVKDLINLIQNLDCYDYAPGISDHEELGQYLINVLEREDIPSAIEPYFDYRAYGEDFAINKGGMFTDTGFVFRNYDKDFIEHYGGRDDIPDEYKIFVYPDPPEKMPIKQQLEMYGRMASAHAADDKPAPECAER